jgi:hypothetical protein
LKPERLKQYNCDPVRVSLLSAETERLRQQIVIL